MPVSAHERPDPGPSLGESLKRLRAVLRRGRRSAPDVPADFPVPAKGELISVERNADEASVTWELPRASEALQSNLTHALRRRGFEVSVATAPGTLLSGGVLAIARGQVRGVVSWSRPGPYEFSPLRMTATFHY